MREFKRENRSEMNDSNRQGIRGARRFKGRSPSGNRSNSGFRGRDSDRFERRGPSREDRIPHKVICDGCGQECEVPFKPTAGKPVYCDDCFKSKGKSSSAKGCNCNCDDELKKLNQKLDMILEVVKGLKTIKDSALAEEKTEKKVAKPKAKKVAKKKK